MATKITPAGVNAQRVTVVQAYATGAAAIDHYFEVDESDVWRLSTIRLHLSAAPTTSENLVITIDSALGAAYDTVLYSVDPSASSITDLVLTSEDFGVAQDLNAGDKLLVEYANTDTGTWGLELLMEAV